MKPMMIIAPNLISAEDIAVLRQNDICVVIAKDPSKIKFVDPIPAQSSRTQIETAAIALSRTLLNGSWKSEGWNSDYVNSTGAAWLFAKVLLQGTALDINGSREEQEQRIIDHARREELVRIGREEARAAKAAKTTEKK